MSWFDRLLGKRRDVRAEREKLLSDKGKVESVRRESLPRVQDREEWASFYSQALRVLEDKSIHPAARLLVMSDEEVLVNELLYQLSQDPIDWNILSEVDGQVNAKLKELIKKVRELQEGTVSVIVKQEQSGFFQRLKKARDDLELQSLSFDGVRGKLSGQALLKKKLSILTNPSIDVAGKLVWVESEEAKKLSGQYFSVLNSLSEFHTVQKETQLHELEVQIEAVIGHEIHSARAGLNLS